MEIQDRNEIVDTFSKVVTAEVVASAQILDILKSAQNPENIYC